MKKIISLVLSVVVVLTFAMFAIGSGSSDKPTVTPGEENTEQVETIVSNKDTIVKVGEMLTANDLSITYVSCEEYTGYNQYFGPKDGNKIIRLYFNVENKGQTDRMISTFEFNCYADDVAMDSYYEDDSISATLSAGRKADGAVYFEVPIDAEVIEVEYETDFWSDGKATFEVVL